MVSNKTLRNIKIITSALITIAFFSILYFFFTFTPMPEGWHLRDSYVIGTLGVFLAGALSRIWTQNLIALCIGTIIGIFIGGVWVELFASDINIGILLAAWTYLTYFGLRDIVMFVSAVSAWIATDFVIKRYQNRFLIIKYRTALLFTVAILAGLMANAIGPLTEYLSFTSYNFRFLRHWESVFFITCIIASLAFGILAGIYYKRSTLYKSVFLILTIAVIGLPMNYSSQLAKQIRYDGLMSLTKQIKPLRAAIEAFHENENKLPDSLDVLVPTYLSQLPETNSGTYSTYEYLPDHEKPAYCIRIWTSSGILNFDELSYCSGGDYSDYTDPSDREPVGEWMYYHE